MKNVSESTNPTPVVVMVGIPGSGRHEAAVRLAEETNLQLLNIEAIQREIERRDPKAFQSVDRRAWQELYRRLEHAVRTGRGAIVDAPNVQRWNRRKIIKVARKVAGNNCHLEAQTMSATLDACLVRNAENPQPVPESVVRHLWALLQHEPVDLDVEGFDSVTTF
jgi:predicted kinase